MSAGWDNQPDVLQEAGQKLQREIAADPLHTRGVGHLPVDPERARLELTEEQRVRRSSRPKSRRWRGLAKLDDKIDALALRLEEASQEAQRAEERVQQAPEEDARTLADWLAAGERGRRPEATLYERQRERDAARLHIEALQRTLDEALEERLRYVERNRDKMLEDARKDVDAARARLLAHVAELPALRADLLDARDLVIWSATFPDAAQSYGFPHALALGLLEPVKATLGTTNRLDYQSVVAALEADADALADRHHVQVLKALGTAPPRTPLTEAMWTEDEEHKAWAKQELERARKLAEWHDPDKLAAEVRE